jgi:flagellar motor switch protein FliM
VTGVQTCALPIYLSVNGKVVARGELVEIDGNLGVRILSLAG